jgi:hypothetical protein
MIVFYWVAGILLALTALPSAFFFVLYIVSGEDGCQRRATMFYRWAALVALTTFNIVIFKHVIGTLIDIWR